MNGDDSANHPADRHRDHDDVTSIRDELHAVLDRLDARSQIIVLLRLDNYTLGELAELMGCSERTIQRQWEQICRHCRSALPD